MTKPTIDDFRTDSVTDFEQSLENDAERFFARADPIESAVCPLCDGSDNKLVHEIYGFSILECTCEFMYLFPRPSYEELSEFYQYGESNVLWHKIMEETKDRRRENFANNIAPLICRHLNHVNNKFVDIGCGNGVWLDALEDVLPGVNTLGVEPFANDDLMRRHSIIRCFLEEMDDREEFDVCSLMSVIEHVSDPIQCLQKSYRILKEGGLLFITAPNMSGFDSLALQPKDRNWEVPQHINFFDVSSAVRCVTDAGFKIVESGTFGFLDVDIVSKSGKDLHNEFLTKLLGHTDNAAAREEFQKFLTNNGLSGQLYVVARK